MERKRKTTAEIIQVIQNKLKEHRATRVYPDPAEPDRIQECKNANLPMYETNKDIKGGVSFIQTLIREKSLWFVIIVFKHWTK